MPETTKQDRAAELVDPLRTVAQAFRDGVAWAVTCHGRDHRLDEGEAGACLRCECHVGEGDRARVLGLRIVCESCQLAVTP